MQCQWTETSVASRWRHYGGSDVTDDVVADRRMLPGVYDETLGQPAAMTRRSGRGRLWSRDPDWSADHCRCVNWWHTFWRCRPTVDRVDIALRPAHSARLDQWRRRCTADSRRRTDVYCIDVGCLHTSLTTSPLHRIHTYTTLHLHAVAHLGFARRGCNRRRPKRGLSLVF